MESFRCHPSSWLKSLPTCILRKMSETLNIVRRWSSSRSNFTNIYICKKDDCNISGIFVGKNLWVEFKECPTKWKQKLQTIFSLSTEMIWRNKSIRFVGCFIFQLKIFVRREIRLGGFSVDIFSPLNCKAQIFTHNFYPRTPTMSHSRKGRDSLWFEAVRPDLRLKIVAWGKIIDFGEI